MYHYYKGAHQSGKFQTFDWSGKISPKFYFDRLLLLKVYKILAKKAQRRRYVSWYWRVFQNLKKNQFFVSKMTRWILIQAIKNLKNLHFVWSLLCKYITFDLNKYRGVIYHDIREWRKIRRKTGLWFWKWHKEFG